MISNTGEQGNIYLYAYNDPKSSYSVVNRLSSKWSHQSDRTSIDASTYLIANKKDMYRGNTSFSLINKGGKNTFDLILYPGTSK